VRLMTLADMLTELRQEAGISPDVSHGSHLTPKHIGLLRRIQEEVYHDFDWPNLNINQTVTVFAGQRYVAYPDKLDFEGIREVFQKAPNGDWVTLGYGVSAEELNTVDSDADERRESPVRWQNYLSLVAEEINTNMAEIWPLPDREVVLRFEGKHKLMPLVNPDTDRSTVDGPVVVLHTAAELLARQRSEDAPLKIQKAQARMASLRQRTSAPNNSITIPNSGRAGRAPGGQRFRTS